MRKPDFCLCENKGADQLRSNCEADQRLCFRCTASTLSLLIKSEISSFYAASGTVHVGLCRTWSETQIVGFLTHRLMCKTDVSVTTMSEFATQKGDLFSDQNHFQLHEYVTMQVVCYGDFGVGSLKVLNTLHSTKFYFGR